MTRFRLTVEYDGAPFMGWQRQRHGPSVQGAIEAAIAATTGEAATVTGCGRTDAGVHAAGQVAHVDIAKPIDAFRLMEAVNAHLRPRRSPSSPASSAAPDFHARFDCIGRGATATVSSTGARRSSSTAGGRGRSGCALDADAMAAAAQVLVGRHDFTTFRSIRCQSRSPVKTLDRLDVARDGDVIEIVAAARSFLHHQVRSMVGCLKLVGEGRWTVDDLAAALAARDRLALGINAPPEGLTFVAAYYGKVSASLTPG